MRYRETLTIPITLDRAARTPLHHQITAQVTAAIETGVLAPGARMPSTRTLAVLLEVSRGVTATAYDVLFERGRVERRGGSGTYVAGARAANGAPPRWLRPAATGPSNAVVDFTPGQQNGEVFPLAAWRAAWRHASCHVPRLAGLPPLGLPELQRALADHLRRTRGLSLTHHEIVVTSGAVAGLRLVLAALGGTAVALEEPAPRGWYHAVAGAGADPVSLPVDCEGARVDAMPPNCEIAVLTADGHLPWGHMLSARRRWAAVEWASRTGGGLIEMACDAVFRPKANRLPRLLDLGGQSCAVGGFCGVLTPGLRLGYAVVPAELAPKISRMVADRAEQPPYVTQLAVAQLLGDGTIVRLMHRRGLVHKRKLALVRAALAPLHPEVTVHGHDAVDTTVLRLPDWANADEVAAALRHRGVCMPTMRSAATGGPPALLLGYGHLPDPALRRGLRALTAALSDAVGAGYPSAA